MAPATNIKIYVVLVALTVVGHTGLAYAKKTYQQIEVAKQAPAPAPAQPQPQPQPQAQLSEEFERTLEKMFADYNREQERRALASYQLYQQKATAGLKLPSHTVHQHRQLAPALPVVEEDYAYEFLDPFGKLRQFKQSLHQFAERAKSKLFAKHSRYPQQQPQVVVVEQVQPAPQLPPIREQPPQQQIEQQQQVIEEQRTLAELGTKTRQPEPAQQQQQQQQQQEESSEPSSGFA